MNKRKKWVVAVSAMLLLQTAMPTMLHNNINVAAESNAPGIVYEENGYYMGDVNNNSEIDLADLVLFQKWLLGDLESEGAHLLRADMNHNGKLNGIDLVLLRKTVIGEIAPEYVEKQAEITYESVAINVRGAESADITISGTPDAEINGTVDYADHNGVWQSVSYAGKFDDNGSYCFHFIVPDSISDIEITIAWSGVRNDFTQETTQTEAEITDVSLKLPQTTVISSTTVTTSTSVETTTTAATTSTTPYAGKNISPVVKDFGTATPSTGHVKMLAVYVDFADVTYLSTAYSNEQIREELFGNGAASYPYESVSAWYERASYGNLQIDGDVYRYTCSGNMADYSSGGFEKMAMEVLKGLDDQIDYSDYDSNGDGIVDCIAFTVPLDNADDAMKQYWYGCTATWFDNAGFSVDGMQLSNYIIMDVMPNAEQMPYLKQTLIHEMGHSMGLPDYYKYQSSDWEGLHGEAGYERMDDSLADFCGFSKLMYGWLKDTEVQAFTGNGSQTFLLDDASNTGSCLILPITSSADDYASEYFLVEYITKTGNNSDMYSNDSGVRIFHVQAETLLDSYYKTGSFKYENYSANYMGDDKIRVLRLVNDNGGFYHAGDSVSYGTSGFAAYDSNGDQSIDTGYTIAINDLIDGKYSITVSKE